MKSHIMFRRVLRDIDEHGRDLEHVLHQYTSLVKPAFEEFVIPTKKYADVIVPRGAENVVAIDLIKQHIQVKRFCLLYDHSILLTFIAKLFAKGILGPLTVQQ